MLKSISSCRYLWRNSRNLHALKKQSSIDVQINYAIIGQNYSQNKTVKCWKCGVERKSVYELFCDKCQILQNPHDSENFFKILGFDENYEIDNKNLTTKYRSMQNLLHPDKFSDKTNEEQQISENYSALVNRAYDVLQSPLKRAVHLLQIKGIKINEDQKSDSPEFLTEIMTLNEEVEEADEPEKLKQLNKKNKEVIEEITNEISTCFKNGDLNKAKETIIKLKYYWSVSSYINNLLRERGIVD